MERGERGGVGRAERGGVKSRGEKAGIIAKGGG